jgi:hypothetical protein
MHAQWRVLIWHWPSLGFFVLVRPTCVSVIRFDLATTTTSHHPAQTETLLTFFNITSS